MATGHCNCASNYVDMRGRRCKTDPKTPGCPIANLPIHLTVSALGTLASILCSVSVETAAGGYLQGNRVGALARRSACFTNRVQTHRSSTFNFAPFSSAIVPGGNNYSTHKGAGDWPHGGGGMHTAHTGGWWYIKLGYAHSPYCNANSHRQGSCDVMLWVR